MGSPWRRVEREWRHTGNGAAKIWFSSPVVVAADELAKIARSGYPEVQSEDEKRAVEALILFITDMLARRLDRPRITVLQLSQRRFSNGVTTAATPFQSPGKWHRSRTAAGRRPAGRYVSTRRPFLTATSSLSA